MSRPVASGSFLPVKNHGPAIAFSPPAHNSGLRFAAASLRTVISLELFSIGYTENNLQESMMPELEPPFRPREKLLELQRYFQNVQKHTYLKGRYDAVTSVGIPLALAASSLFLIGRGVYNMSHGIGKKD